jgi:hypothetical protein
MTRQPCLPEEVEEVLICKFLIREKVLDLIFPTMELAPVDLRSTSRAAHFVDTKPISRCSNTAEVGRKRSPYISEQMKLGRGGVDGLLLFWISGLWVYAMRKQCFVCHVWDLEAEDADRKGHLRAGAEKSTSERSATSMADVAHGYQLAVNHPLLATMIT